MKKSITNAINAKQTKKKPKIFFKDLIFLKHKKTLNTCDTHNSKNI